MERDPNKRKVKPPSIGELVNLDDIDGESSSDSDFRIEDHYVNSESDSDRASYLSYSDGLFKLFFYWYIILILIDLLLKLIYFVFSKMMIIQKKMMLVKQCVTRQWLLMTAQVLE